MQRPTVAVDRRTESDPTRHSRSENRRPRPVPQLMPETEEEKKLFEGALRRRQIRLILGGKMKPDDALELKALFTKE